MRLPFNTELQQSDSKIELKTWFQFETTQSNSMIKFAFLFLALFVLVSTSSIDGEDETEPGVDESADSEMGSEMDESAFGPEGDYGGGFEGNENSFYGGGGGGGGDEEYDQGGY